MFNWNSEEGHVLLFAFLTSGLRSQAHIPSTISFNSLLQKRPKYLSASPLIEALTRRSKYFFFEGSELSLASQLKD